MDADPDNRSRLPLFPLRSVLFPGGLLPLQIFEVRYLDMIGRCHREGAPFGVVCLTEGSDTRQRADTPGGDGFAREAFHPVGTLARIDLLQRPRPGLMLIRCTGTQRFRLRRSEPGPYGLWLGDIEPIADDAAVPVPDDLAFARTGLQRVLRQITADLPDAPGAAEALPIAPPHHWDDCGWLANRWCDLLPLEPAAKQRLLEQPSPLLRLELVADVLRQMKLAVPDA